MNFLLEDFILFYLLNDGYGIILEKKIVVDRKKINMYIIIIFIILLMLYIFCYKRLNDIFVIKVYWFVLFLIKLN